MPPFLSHAEGTEAPQPNAFDSKALQDIPILIPVDTKAKIIGVSSVIERICRKRFSVLLVAGLSVQVKKHSYRNCAVVTFPSGSVRDPVLGKRC